MSAAPLVGGGLGGLGVLGALFGGHLPDDERPVVDLAVEIALPLLLALLLAFLGCRHGVILLADREGYALQGIRQRVSARLVSPASQMLLIGSPPNPSKRPAQTRTLHSG